MTKSIVPWKCYICGREFKLSFAGGGLCSKCNEPVCKAHMKIRNNKEIHPDKLKEKTTYYCDTCFRLEDDSAEDI